MNYLKFYTGGNLVRKFDIGGFVDPQQKRLEEMNALMMQRGLSMEQSQKLYDLYNGDLSTINTMFDDGLSVDDVLNTDEIKDSNGNSVGVNLKYGVDYGTSAADKKNANAQEKTGVNKSSGLSASAWGMLAKAGTGAIDAVDNALMGDKNFGAQSQAIDSMVDTTSQALISSGNPYFIAAGFGLKGANFLTKAGGQTVQGADIDIKSSGYGQLNHIESSSSRDFGAILGLGGLNAAATQRKLKKRNEEVQMALKAANVADTISFEQEARMNSVDDVLQQNQIALNGGIDTSLLAAKKGGKLIYIEDQNWDKINKIISDALANENIIKAKNGAKLESIETSEEPNVIPEGALHKNKHDIDLDGITQKGIPVITVDDPNAETFEDIKASESSIQQQAEVEESEIIFNKELTLFIENMRKQWHEKDNNDDSICLEAGMRLAKEIIENTEDNTDVTQKAIEAVENENN